MMWKGGDAVRLNRIRWGGDAQSGDEKFGFRDALSLAHLKSEISTKPQIVDAYFGSGSRNNSVFPLEVGASR